MTNRPTPRQIIDWNIEEGDSRQPEWIIDALAEHGYMIVHPDDQRARDEAIIYATATEVGSVYDDEYPLPKRRINRIIDAAVKPQRCDLINNIHTPNCEW